MNADSTTIPVASFSSALWDDVLWEPLLESMRRQKVVPIIGPELAVGSIGDHTVTVDRFVADALATEVGIDLAATPSASVNDVVRLAKNKNLYDDLIYSRISRILSQTSLKPAPVLHRLAAISDIKLFVTLSYDTLLEQAINIERQTSLDHSRNSYYPPDSPSCDLQWTSDTVVYYLLGRHRSVPEFAVTDGDLIESMLGLHSANAPIRLLEYLRDSYLLFLGGAFPDWLFRFLIRSIKQKPLLRSMSFDRTMDILADSLSHTDSNLVGFISAFSSKTRFFNADAETFVDELCRRWTASQSAALGRPVSKNAKAAHAKSVFISYASEDASAAARLAEQLTALGLSPWLDRRDMAGGSAIDSTIADIIETCALFIPLLSHNTERRVENAYFRTEWQQASRRADGNAPGVTFIYPVIIDDIALPDLRTVAIWRRTLLIRRAPRGQLDQQMRDELSRIVFDRASQ